MIEIILGIGLPAIGGIISVWVITAQRIKALEVRVAILEKEFEHMGEIRETLAMHTGILEGLTSHIERIADKLEDHSREIRRNG